MKTILISGGTSGIGLEAARQILERGYRVVVLGRTGLSDRELHAIFGHDRPRLTLLTGDLSTHAGVREAGQRILANANVIDGIVHTAGVVLLQNERTVDGLNLAFSVNYLARYHLTQLLLPALRLSSRPHVIMLTARVEPSFAIDFEQFPHFTTYRFPASTDHMWIANYHYAAHLAHSEPGLWAGVVHPGKIGTRNTRILRAAPWYMRAASVLLGPFLMNSPRQAAHNAVQACLRDDWHAPAFWDVVDDFASRTPIVLDDQIARRVLDISYRLTGV